MNNDDESVNINEKAYHTGSEEKSGGSKLSVQKAKDENHEEKINPGIKPHQDSQEETTEQSVIFTGSDVSLGSF